MNRLVRLLIGWALGVLPSGCHEKVIAADEPGAPLPPVEPAVTPSMPVLPGGSPANVDPLRADLEIAGTPVTSWQLACGQCVDLSAGVRGGRPPYSYSWSDAALSGSGPHHVCPRGPVDYLVQVTDAPSQGEIRRASMQAEAHLRLDVGPCASMPDPGPGVGAPKDAGGPRVPVTPTTRHDAGRLPPIDAGAPRHDASSPPVPDAGGQSRVCPCSNAVTWEDEYFADPSFENLSASTRIACSGTPSNELISSAGAGSAPVGFYYLGLSLPTSESETLRQPLRAGQRYWLSWDMASTSLITAITGIPLGVVDIFGATAPCATSELLGEQTFRPTDWGGWIHVCVEFVPSRNYPYVVISARVGNGAGTGFVSFDEIRVAPYTPSPTDYLFPSCGVGPLDQPFP